MDEKVKSKNDAAEVDLQRLFTALLHKSWLIILVAILCAVLTFVGTFYFVTPVYKSSALFYVNNGSMDIAGISVSSSDLISSRYLVDSYIVVLETRDTLERVMDYAGVDYSYETMKGMITAEAVNGTEIFQVVVTSPDPVEAEAIANAIEQILPTRLEDIITNSTAKVVDSAIVPSSPSSPSYTKNTLMGFLIGFVLCAAAILLHELFDVTIRTEEDVQRCCPHPVLASVPDMTAQSKGGYYYYGSKRASAANTAKEPVLIGPGISFAASEAYKLLRTKLQFSFVDEQDCHIIGVASALAGEGKSLSSINLAYSLAQLDKRVLLIDCDMRRPSLSVKLPIEKVPGLSNYLTRQVHKDEVVQKYTTEQDGTTFDVISSGGNPPNPIELLSSARMNKMLGQMRQNYDYIILDLPPVGEVSDALVASKLADGVLLVVRENYCNSNILGEAVEQFKFVESRILGVVLNCTVESSGGYGKHYKSYRRYYHRYGSYGHGSYSTAARKNVDSGDNK